MLRIDLSRWSRVLQDIFIVNCTQLDDFNISHSLWLYKHQAPAIGALIVGHVLPAVAFACVLQVLAGCVLEVAGFDNDVDAVGAAASLDFALAYW